MSGDGWGDDGWEDFSTGSDERLEELKKQNEVLNQELDDLRALNVSGNCAHLTQLHHGRIAGPDNCFTKTIHSFSRE